MTADAGADAKLGDFGQAQLNASVAVPILSGTPGVTVTLANQDLLNTITIARRPNFVQNGSNTATIPPLGSITIDASRTIWGLAPNGTLPLLIFPGGGNWAPSPAQVAAQIAALGLAKESTQLSQTSGATIATDVSNTGVPLLSKSTLLLSSLNHNLAGGGSSTSTSVLTLNQIGYEVQILVHETTSVGPTPTAGVEFQFLWTDSGTGQIVGDERWNIFPSSFVSGLDQIVVGTGPTKGDQLQVFVTNNDAVQVNWGIIILLNSRVYARDDLRCPGPEGFNGVAGQTRSDSDLTSNLVGATLNTNQAAGNTDTKIIPLVAGRVKLHWDSASAAADCEMIIRAASISRVSGAGQTNIIFDKFCDGTGNGNEYFTLPRGQCTVAIKNGNAAAKTTRWVMTFEEY